MTYRANPILKKLDEAAESTGFPAFSRKASAGVAIPFRIIPLTLLGVAIAGLVLQARAFPAPGFMIVLLAIMAGAPLHMMGPMRRPLSGMRDEREQAVVRSGQFAGLSAVALFAVGGCFLIAMAKPLAIIRLASIWVPSLSGDWFALGLFMIALHLNVAVAYVSWKMPWRVVGDDED